MENKNEEEKKIIIPLDEIEKVDISDRNIERIAKGFIVGSTAIGKRKEVRDLLEDKVIKRIGKKGKYLTDKLFELIEGVYIAEKDTTMSKTGPRMIKYYKVPPNLQAITYALDRVLGKPTQHVESNKQKEGIAVVEQIIKSLEGGKTVETTKRIEIKK